MLVCSWWAFVWGQEESPTPTVPKPTGKVRHTYTHTHTKKKILISDTMMTLMVPFEQLQNILWNRLRKLLCFLLTANSINGNRLGKKRKDDIYVFNLKHILNKSQLHFKIIDVWTTLCQDVQLHKNHWRDFHETWMGDRSRSRADPFYFWCWSIRIKESRNFVTLYLTLQYLFYILQ